MDKYNALCYLSTLNKASDSLTLIAFLLLIFGTVVIPIFGPIFEKYKETIVLEIIDCSLLFICETVNALIPDKELLNTLYEEGAYWKIVELGENIEPTIKLCSSGIAIVTGISLILFTFAVIITVLRKRGELNG